MQSRELKEWICKESWNESLRACGIWERSQGSWRPSATTSNKWGELLTWCTISTAKPRRSSLKFIMLLPMKRNRRKLKGSWTRATTLQKKKIKAKATRRKKQMEEAPQRRRLTRRKEVKLTKVSPTRKRTKRSFTRSWSLIQWVLMTLIICFLPSQLPSIRSWKRVRACKPPKNLSRILLRRSLTLKQRRNLKSTSKS